MCILSSQHLYRLSATMVRHQMRFKSVLAWLTHVRSVRAGQSIKDRKRLSRARQSSGGEPPVSLRGGRPGRGDDVRAESCARARRRWKGAARKLLPALSNHVIRVRAIAKGCLVEASDVRRALRFGHAFRRITRSPRATLVALLYERAWRHPRLSAHLLRRQRLNSRLCASALEATWKSITETHVKAPASRPNHQFWPGPSAFSAARGPWLWQRSDVEDVMQCILASRNNVNATVMAAKLTCIPHISSYFAFGFLRDLQAAGLIRLHHAVCSASEMSSNVATAAAMCPLPAWRNALLRYHGHVRSKFGYGDTALVACETIKALHTLGFRDGRQGGEAADALVQEIGGGGGQMLLQSLQQCRPLSWQDVVAHTGVRSTETSLVDECLPQVSAWWEATPHACKGSESLSPLLLAQLRSRGFLMHSVPPR